MSSLDPRFDEPSDPHSANEQLMELRIMTKHLETLVARLQFAIVGIGVLFVIAIIMEFVINSQVSDLKGSLGT